MVCKFVQCCMIKVWTCHSCNPLYEMMRKMNECTHIWCIISCIYYVNNMSQNILKRISKIKSNEMEKPHILASSSYICCVQICSTKHDKSIDNATFSLKFLMWHDKKKIRKVHIYDVLSHVFFVCIWKKIEFLKVICWMWSFLHLVRK